MLDLLKIIEKTRKKEGLRKLELLNIRSADRLEQADYKALVDRFIFEAGLTETTQKFSRAKFEELRAMTKGLRG